MLRQVEAEDRIGDGGGKIQSLGQFRNGQRGYGFATILDLRDLAFALLIAEGLVGELGQGPEPGGAGIAHSEAKLNQNIRRNHLSLSVTRAVEPKGTMRDRLRRGHSINSGSGCTVTESWPTQHLKGLMMLSVMMANWLWLASPAGVNAVFAVVCVAAAMGAPARAVMWVSAALYLALLVL